MENVMPKHALLPSSLYGKLMEIHGAISKKYNPAIIQDST
jgi:hypothetical protein